jgi:antitoxin ParD1/3/4
MATMNISLPDKMKEWVESRLASGFYGNASDYIRDLIRKDREAVEYRAWFESEIEKGYASGFTEGTVEDVFNDMIAVSKEAVSVKEKMA